jgi:WD40 repeat protein
MKKELFIFAWVVCFLLMIGCSSTTLKMTPLPITSIPLVSATQRYSSTLESSSTPEKGNLFTPNPEKTDQVSTLSASPTVSASATPEPLLITAFNRDSWNFAYSSDGKMIAVSYGKTVTIYDAKLEKELIVFAKPSAGISESGKVVFFNKDTKLAANVDLDGRNDGPGTHGSIYVWDLTTKLLKNQYPMEGIIYDFDVSYDGAWLAISDDNFGFTLWNRRGGWKRVWETGAYDLAFSPTELALAVPGWAGPGDPALRILDPSTNRIEELFYQPENLSEQASHRADDVAFSPDGRLLALLVQDQLRLWDREASQEIAWPTSMTFAPLFQVEISSKETLATLDYTGLITLFNARTGQSLGSINTRSSVQITFSPNGEFLLIGGYDYPLQIWQIPWLRK